MHKLYELVCFTESKIENMDIISCPGYTSLTQPRKQILPQIRGISLYSKRKYPRYIKLVDLNSDHIFWLEIEKK